MSEAEKKGFKLKGFIKKGEKVLAKEAPPELKNVAAQQEEFLDAKPSVLTTAVKQMFGKPKPAIEKALIPIVPTATIEKKIEDAAIVKEEKKEKPVALKEVLEEDYDEALQKLGTLILEEEKGDHYVNEIPKAYVPETRRGFSDFIKGEFNAFMLKPVSEQEPVAPGDKYPYQKFIREYIRQASPYRGILVYHGLGSGKTCSAIAASEALFSTSNKKIIVMTPRSLRKNFLNEISFCGFRHYKLQNYWVKLDKSVPIHVAFAKSVLNISDTHLKKATHIWVPDFEQSPNYDSLSPDEQTEIRKQILSILVYDEKTNPTGRIHFISYNGIDSTKLKKIACNNPTYFDDSVIIVDEIHNLIRLMTGKIEPYLSNAEKYAPGTKVKRRIVQETVGADKWKPSLCLSPRNYRRGYLFYRLFLSARNSKIIGLSGTPLINFPEEIGILANVLHGYIPIVEGIIAVSGEEIEKRIRGLLLEFIYTDFVRVEPDSAGSGIRFMVSLLPEGVRKISNDIGVERFPDGVAIPTLQEILAELKEVFTQKGFRFSLEPQLIAKSLLPIYHEDFVNKFINNGKVTNSIVLMKRLTGIISYYKGSRQDLMPKVVRDVVVRVPMSEYQQNKYVIERSAEIAKDKKTKSKSKTNPIISEAFELGVKDSSNSYRMASRQICNFAFPPQVIRPRPNNQEELEEEAPLDEDISDTPADINDNTESFPELGDDEEELSKEEIAAQEKALDSEDGDSQEGGDEEEELEVDQEGGDQEGGDDSDEEAEPEVSEDPLTEIYKKYFKTRVKRVLAERLPQGATDEEKKALRKTIRKEVKLTVLEELKDTEPSVEYFKKEYNKEKRLILAKQQQYLQDKALLEAKKPQTVAKAKGRTAKDVLTATKEALNAAKLTLNDCKIGRKQGEAYIDAIHRVKKCLIQFASDNLRSDNPEGLRVLSAKYVAMLQNIQNAPGSSLVYSQFLDMEGVGIFRMAMDINGYAPIEILSTDKGDYQFSERTIASFKKGSLQPRYITFSGQEKEDVRKLGLDVFNARFNELPESLLNVLLEAGFKDNDNKRGQICRVFCITSAGAEGISLKNVRAVHIMEPYWNYVRLKQVKGRAIRIGSHLDLPPKDRNVSIYTYVSVFSKESQISRSGPMKIDETVSMKDGIPRKEAIDYGIPVDEDITHYTLTSDERLYVVSEIKRNIIEQLENVMKSAAVDCEINYAENKDGTFKCYPLKGSVGDFLYHPDIEKDILESASMFELTEKKEEKKKTRYTTYKGTRYAIIEEEATNKFKFYNPDDLETPIGEAASKDGKPTLPITMY
jgi:hypothetical protein